MAATPKASRVLFRVAFVFVLGPQELVLRRSESAPLGLRSYFAPEMAVWLAVDQCFARSPPDLPQQQIRRIEIARID